MDSMPRSKDRSRGELEKLRAMSFKEKLEYIWNYYYFHIIGTIIAIVAVISLVRSCTGNPETGVYIIWMSPYIDAQVLSDIGETLTERLFPDESGIIADTEYMYLLSEDPQVIMAMRERLIAMLAAGVIDIIISDIDTLNDLAEAEFITPLNDIIDEINRINPAALSDAEIVTVFSGNYNNLFSSVKNITGIKITGAPLLNDFSVTLSTDAYLSLSVSSKNKENAVLAIIEFFNLVS